MREEYFNFFNKKSHFDVWIDEHTANRQFVACHTAGTGLSWADRLFVGRCDPEVEPFKLGCTKFWRDYSEKISSA